MPEAWLPTPKMLPRDENGEPSLNNRYPYSPCELVQQWPTALKNMGQCTCRAMALFTVLWPRLV